MSKDTEEAPLSFTAGALNEVWDSQAAFWQLLDFLMYFRDNLDEIDVTPENVAKLLDLRIRKVGNGATRREDVVRRRELMRIIKGLSREEQLLNLTTIRKHGRLAVEPRPRLRLVT